VIATHPFCPVLTRPSSTQVNPATSIIYEWNGARPENSGDRYQLMSRGITETNGMVNPFRIALKLNIIAASS
jgi:hypothetical protein